MYIKLYRNRLGFIEDMTKHFGVFYSVHSVEIFQLWIEIFGRNSVRK